MSLDTTDGGALRSALANAMVGIKKQFYGKGPIAAKAYLNDDYVFIVLEDGLTRNEETLLAAGEEDMVRSVRLRFQEIMTVPICSEIEKITGRKVMSYNSQIVFNPTRTIEIFLLEPAPGGVDIPE